MKLKDKLIKMDACSEAVEWVGDKDFKEAWETCPRGDWMLWLAAKLKVNHRTLTLAKGRCAETVINLMTNERSINAVKAAIAYGNGEIKEKQLNAAADAAYATYAAAATAADAAYAVAAADAAYATYAAAATAAATAADARVKNQKATADICREILSEELSKVF